MKSIRFPSFVNCFHLSSIVVFHFISIRHCGNSSRNYLAPIYSSHNITLQTFSYQNTKPGVFNIQWKMVEKKLPDTSLDQLCIRTFGKKLICNETYMYTGHNGTISVGFPYDAVYEPGTICNWTITVESGMVCIFLIF